MQNKILLTMTLLTTSVMISGCDSLHSTFGLDHYQAKEFEVPTNPPLSMPPDYNLRPPVEGAPNRGEVPHIEKAQEKVLGKKVTLSKTGDKAEKSILTNASKGVKANPNIRSEVEKDAEYDETIMGKLSSIKNKAVTNLTTSKGTDGAVATDSKVGVKKSEPDSKD